MTALYAGLSVLDGGLSAWYFSQGNTLAGLLWGVAAIFNVATTIITGSS